MEDKKIDFYPNYEEIDPTGEIYINIREYKIPNEEFYEAIDGGIKEVVALLRNNGINTVCSCAHEKYIQFNGNEVQEVELIYTLLYNYGFKNFTIEYKLMIGEEMPERHGEIRFDEFMGRKK
jgi:hypothetical protein